ncbi:chemotaxis protein CheB [Arenimonas terrae]|jgi:chemosensory pili system protein ChpB (putative protein-glutamate methylesterase)|uniref:protein-glutamate methylesterase n=1 Tax=Arenimonas terrae TaxID=2546226 RepID=A0A5C4RVQ7_9GAMM|nr:chemotaxis protein CheB [Arenimonas terrae]TNJ35336.1 hypothetical protein E1B00_06160 [Arenimonas terrae]
MLESPVRVALLARPGDARDQLRRALAELGAQLVAEGDPAELDPGTVAGEKPSVVLVSLEPAVEDALSRFDDLLAAPGVEVMYDDAEVTRQLDGWDLARWARHLAAKLVGGDLLPPAPGGADHLPEFDLSPQPGAPPTPAQEMAHEKLEDYAAESLDLSEWVPSTPSLADVPVETAEVEPAVAEPGLDDAELELDLGDLEQAMGRADAQVETTPRGVPGLDDSLDFDPQSMDIDLSALPEEGARLTVADDTDSLDLADEPLLADVELADGPVSFSSFSEDDVALAEGMDDDVAALAAQLDAYEASEQRQVPKEPDFSSSVQAPVADSPGKPAPTAPAARSSGFGALELIPMDAEIEAGAAVEEAVSAGGQAPKSGRGAGLSLADAESVHESVINNGALLVFAGLGGPDAVRQLLSALPPTLPVPVLLYQHLDTGKHDRLVGQLAKASRLPLDLALEGKLAFSGRVAVLPPGVGIRHGDGNFTFTQGGDLPSIVSALPAADSMVLLLSGAAASVVPAVLALKASGARVLAQTPATCFDASAAESVIAAGAEVAEPSELARLIVERWT